MCLLELTGREEGVGGLTFEVCVCAESINVAVELHLNY